MSRRVARNASTATEAPGDLADSRSAQPRFGGVPSSSDDAIAGAQAGVGGRAVRRHLATRSAPVSVSAANPATVRAGTLRCASLSPIAESACRHPRRLVGGAGPGGHVAAVESPAMRAISFAKSVAVDGEHAVRAIGRGEERAHDPRRACACRRRRARIDASSASATRWPRAY